MMELRSRVGAILAVEEQQPTDWRCVELLTIELKRELLDATDTPEIVNHFLDDIDIRRKPSQRDYAERQRAELRRFITTGEYAAVRIIPRWTCGALLALLTTTLAALLFF